MTSNRPTNAFDAYFLSWLLHRDADGPSAPEAEHGGPWAVREDPAGFAVVRELARHEEPYAVLAERETALLLAAILPTLGREQRYQIDSAERIAGVEVRALVGGRLKKVGWLSRTDPELLEGLKVVEWLLRSPASLALVLEAASYPTLDRAGRILRRRLTAADEARPAASSSPRPPEAESGGSKPLVRDLMCRGEGVPRVETSTTIRDTIYELARGKIDAVAVTAEGRLVGWLSAVDLRDLLESGEDVLDRRAGDFSKAGPPTISGTACAAQALERMKELDVMVLFVCDEEGRLEGVAYVNTLWRLGIFGETIVETQTRDGRP